MSDSPQLNTNLLKILGFSADGKPSLTLGQLSNFTPAPIDSSARGLLNPVIDNGGSNLPPLPPEPGGGGGGSGGAGKNQPNWGLIVFGLSATVALCGIVYSKIKSHAERVREERNQQQMDGLQNPPQAGR